MTEIAEMIDPVTGEIVDTKELAEQLLRQAKAQGVELVGPGGLLNRLTKTVLETALDAEMTEHLGYDKHDPSGRNSGNSRNGTRAKTVWTEIGPVEIEVPRDTESSFEPQIVKKRQRRLTGVDEIVCAPRGAVDSDEGERPASLGRRSGRVKLAAACPWGTPGVGGSSRDEVRTVQYYRMGRVW
jgi:hypothetical protein